MFHNYLVMAGATGREHKRTNGPSDPSTMHGKPVLFARIKNLAVGPATAARYRDECEA